MNAASLLIEMLGRDGRVGDVFWAGMPTKSEPVITVHKIARVLSALTPADTECEEYVAVCGRTGQSWCSPSMGIPETWTAENANSRPAGAALCSTCFPNR